MQKNLYQQILKQIDGGEIDHALMVNHIRGLGLPRLELQEIAEDLRYKLRLIDWIREAPFGYETTDDLMLIIDKMKEYGELYSFYYFLLNCLEIVLEK